MICFDPLTAFLGVIGGAIVLITLVGIAAAIDEASYRRSVKRMIAAHDSEDA